MREGEGVKAVCEDKVPLSRGSLLIKLKVLECGSQSMRMVCLGQFIVLEYRNMEGTPQSRSYTVTNKGDDWIEILVQKAGNAGVSDAIHDCLCIGDTVSLAGHGGNVTVEGLGQVTSVLMVAAGVGVTLPMALIRELCLRDDAGVDVPKVQLVLSVKGVEDIPFIHELLSLQLRKAWFSLLVHVTGEIVKECSVFKSGRISDSSLFSGDGVSAFIISGGHDFVRFYTDKSKAFMPTSSCFTEAFFSGGMDCEQVVEKNLNSGLLTCVVKSGGGERVHECELNGRLLDVLLGRGERVRHQCRSGICGSCRIKVLSGDCTFAEDFCLSDHDKENGYSLACCTYPNSKNLVVEIE